MSIVPQASDSTQLGATTPPIADAAPIGVTSLPRLRPGERLDQPTFHARYEAMPPGETYELIEGIVWMQMSLGQPHGRVHAKVMGWLALYEEATPGVEGFDNMSTILGPAAEPQPDACLIVLPEKGGQMRSSTASPRYLEGGAELIVEVADSTENLDLNNKKRDYERAGVREYIVVALRQKKVYWFANRDGAFVELEIGPDGVFRSQVFAGLWLDAAAALRADVRGMLSVLRTGLATPEHAAFVESLAQR